LETWLEFYGYGVLDAVGKKKLEYAELELEREAKEKRHRTLRAELAGQL
jgi:hypothetical protein